MAEHPPPNALQYDRRSNALPQHRSWNVTLPHAMDVDRAGGRAGGSTDPPTALGSRMRHAWHNETLARGFPVSPGASSYTTSTSTSASSSLNPAGPSSASATPWSYAGHMSGENLQGGHSPRPSAHLGTTTQDDPVDATPLPTAILKSVVASPAHRDASETRRKAERRFPCPSPGCDYASTRKENLKGEQLPFYRHTTIVDSSNGLTQTMLTRTWALGRMDVSGMVVENGSRGSTTVPGMRKSASISSPWSKSRPGMMRPGAWGVSVYRIVPNNLF